MHSQEPRPDSRALEATQAASLLEPERTTGAASHKAHAHAGPLPQPESALIARGLHGAAESAPGAVSHHDDSQIRALLSMYFTRWSKFGEGWGAGPAIGMYRPDAHITDIAPNIEKLLKHHKWEQEYSGSAAYARSMSHLYGTVDQFQMDWDPGQATLSATADGKICSEISFQARISKAGLNINQRVHASIVWERSGKGFLIARESLHREAFQLPSIGPF